MTDRFSRRTLLAGAGVGAALVPLLHASRAAAQATPPKRLIIIAWPNGVVADAFWPTGGETNFVIDASESSPLKPLIPHRNDIIIFGGTKLQCLSDDRAPQGHAAFPYLLTGTKGTSIPSCINPDCWKKTAGGPSVDQVIADEIAKKAKLPFHSLQLAVASEDNRPGRYLSYRGPAIGGQANAPSAEEDPIRMFTRLFAGPLGTGMGDEAVKRILAERRSIFDYVGRSLDRLGRRLGTEDRDKIQGHLSAVRDIERQISAPAAGCAPPEAIAGGKDYTQKVANPHFHEVVKLHCDLVVAAMRCDLTRVATMAWARSHNNGVTFFWLGKDLYEGGRAGDTGGFGGPYRHHHEIAHNAGREPYRTMKNKVDQWFFSMFAYLIQKMKEAPEGRGTMLDNSALLFANCMSNGGSHSVSDLPWVLAGKAGGYFKTGRFLRNVSPAGQVPHNGVLVALANAMDAPRTTFGDPSYGGEITQLKG